MKTNPTQCFTKKNEFGFALFGGPGGIRTLDLCVANAALSQLSYGPIFCSTANIITQSFKKIQSYFLFFAIFCMQKGPTALGRPFPHKLFVYFAAHDIETQSIVPRDGPISQRAREENHTPPPASLLMASMKAGMSCFLRETTPLSQMVPAFGARPKASSTSISADSP